ncbi:MAG TPA: hypothetical protein VNO55_19760 [Polyangia bacterium]|nr:hypothetical protein [Polyangia bacterium]
MPYHKSRGAQQRALDPAGMARACRKLAADLRVEAAAGKPAIQLTADSGGVVNQISRGEAAARMDQQAARWEAEADTGARNEYDRSRLGL